MALPALWRDYGALNGATGVVLHCHSVGTAIRVVIAAFHATNSSSYPLAGLILSAWSGAVELPPESVFPPRASFNETGNPISYTWPQNYFDEMMLGVSQGLVDPEVVKHHAIFNGPLSVTENEDIRSESLWRSYGTKKAQMVRFPIMAAVGTDDAFVQRPAAVLAWNRDVFQKSPRTELSCIKCAPHSIELSWFGAAWYAKCCGFAMQMCC